MIGSDQSLIIVDLQGIDDDPILVFFFNLLWFFVQVFEAFTPKGHYPQILHDLMGHILEVDHIFLHDVGFRVAPYMGLIQKDLAVLITLFERWDSTINAFYLPTSPITITIEDLHRILRLPIKGEPIILLQTWDEAQPFVWDLFGDEFADELMLLIQAGGLTYYHFWCTLSSKEHLDLLRDIYFMCRIMCYGALDTGGGRFPQTLMGFLHRMVTSRIRFAWASGLLALIYIELFLLV